MNVRHSMGVLHSFSIKNIFYDKMDLRLFYFHVAKHALSQMKNSVSKKSKSFFVLTLNPTKVGLF